MEKRKVFSQIKKIILKIKTFQDTAPKKVRLFLQKPTLNFDDVETTTSVQDLDLTEQQVLKGEPIQLKHSKFQTLSHLTVNSFETLISEIPFFFHLDFC